MSAKNQEKIPIINPKDRRFTLRFMTVVAILFIFSLIALRLDFGSGVSNFQKAGRLLLQMVQMDLSDWQSILGAALVSFAVAILATILSAVAAFFFSFGASQNLSPTWLVNGIKGFAAIIRAVPTLVWTLIFVAYVGLGPFAGVLGLFLHSFAYLIKAYSESIELIDNEDIVALRATGASWAQVIANAVLPASITAFISWTALRFEINVSESTILGMVGAGGIGHELTSAMRSYDFATAGFVVLVIFLMSFSIEMIFHRIKMNVDINAR